MKMIEEFIQTLESSWSTPRNAVHRGKNCPFRLCCSIDPVPATDVDIRAVLAVPEEGLKQFWRRCRQASLFKDVDYGQWGVEILSPDRAIRESAYSLASRPKDFLCTDLVFGKFFGDSELLVMNCDSSDNEYGSIRVALPIDKRNNWPLAAHSFAEFG